MGAAAVTAASDQFVPGTETTKKRWKHGRKQEREGERSWEKHTCTEGRDQNGTCKGRHSRVGGKET